MSDLTHEDVQYARAILAAAYGQRFASQVQVTENTLLILAEIITESGRCSDNMDLVPRPHHSLSKPAISYAKKLVRQIGKELIMEPAKKHYYICNVFAFQSRRGMFF